ncbi:MAG: hypothetical protein KGH93_01615 [Patescibacteria group bacterium]|nr:hypothetical protein [Patescibacteria group bacterium]MDE1945879.1 hypothetical protein [Patescibacteria group bacterium]
MLKTLMMLFFGGNKENGKSNGMKKEKKIVYPMTLEERLKIKLHGDDFLGIGLETK